MSELSALKVGCGKFFYGKNVLSQLPGEILRLGGKALIIGGEHALSSFNLIAGNMLSASNFELITHHDQCTKEKAEYYFKFFKSKEVSVCYKRLSSMNIQLWLWIVTRS